MYYHQAVHMSDPVLPLGVVTTVTEAYLPTKDTDPSKVGSPPLDLK